MSFQKKLETLQKDLPKVVHLEQTLHIALLLAKEADETKGAAKAKNATLISSFLQNAYQVNQLLKEPSNPYEMD